MEGDKGVLVSRWGQARIGQQSPNILNLETKGLPGREVTDFRWDWLGALHTEWTSSGVLGVLVNIGKKDHAMLASWETWGRRPKSGVGPDLERLGSTLRLPWWLRCGLRPSTLPMAQCSDRGFL